MYRLMLPKDKLEEFIILVTFDKLFDPETMDQDSEFNEFFERIESAGLKSKLFSYYFDIDSNLRNRYKKFKKEFTQDDTDVMIYLIDRDEDENE